MASAASYTDQILRPDKQVGEWLIGWQKQVITNEWTIQDMSRRQAISRATAPAKASLKSANDAHLQRLRTGYFDGVYKIAARTVDPNFELTAADRAFVQAQSVEHYTKLRNARAYAARDTERFVSHVWEDVASRRKRFVRKTAFLGKRLEEKGFDGIEKQYGVKAGVFADGRKYNLEKYSRLQSDAFANRLYNAGVLAAAERTGAVAIRVSDGPDCGWTNHNDPEKANGKLVTIDEARSAPSAHPYCQRRFSPSNKKKDTDELKRRLQREGARLIVKRAAAGVAVAGLSAYAASALSNVVAAQASRFLRSTLFSEWVDHLRALTWAGNPTAARFLQIASRFEDFMDPVETEIIEMRLRGDNVRLLPYAFKAENVWPGGPTWDSMPELWRNIRIAGDGFLNHGREVPAQVGRFLNAVAPGRRSEEQFQLAYEYIKGAARSKETLGNVRNVINAEFQRRNLLQRTFLRLPGGEFFASRVGLTWTKWGTRLRLDPTDWLRGHLTVTPTGLIQSLSFFPKAALKGTIKMYQDGSIGGHISAIPKNFLNGVFRAIVEIDERGALIGNIRIVPKGPLRVVMEFTTRTPREVATNLADQATLALKIARGGAVSHMSVDDIANFSVRFMQNHASPLGFRVRDFAEDLASRLVEAEIMEHGSVEALTEALVAQGARLTFDPRDIVRAARTFGAARVAQDLGWQVRQFKFHRMVVEYRIFNQSIFDISLNLRLPVEFVRNAVQDLALQHVLSPAGNGTWTGLFRWVVTNPVEAVQTMRVSSGHIVEAGGTGVKSTLFGNIRFSGLRAVEENPFLNALKRGSVRFLSRAHFDQDGLRDIATNMKIFGWNVYDIANVLKIRAGDVKQLVQEGQASFNLTAYRLGFRQLDEALPFWDKRVDEVRNMLTERATGNPINREDALLRIADTMKNASSNPGDKRALRYLAGVKPGDSARQIQVKYLHLRNWMRTVEGTEDIAWRFADQAEEGAAAYRLLGQRLGEISIDDLIAKAQDEVRNLNVVHLRRDTNFSVEQAVDKLDYMFGRFQNFFLAERSWGLNTIQNSWDKLVRVWDLKTKRFIPNSWQNNPIPQEVRDTAAQWQRYAIATSDRSIEIGDIRIIADDEVMGALSGARLIDEVDPAFMEQVILNNYYMRRRFPNIDLPEYHLVRSPNGPALSYYRDGKIHFDYGWATKYDISNAQLQGLLRMNKISGHPQTHLRHQSENTFRMIMFHEYGHYLMEHLDDAQIEDFARLVSKRFDIRTLVDDEERIFDVLADQRALTGARTMDPLGSPFAQWRRLAIERTDFKDYNSFRKMRVIRRQSGMYASTNLDELGAENIAHYLEFNDPNRMSRTVGQWMDEQLLGRAAADRVTFNFASNVDFDPAKREIIETVFENELPSTATDKFKAMALKVANSVDATLDRKSLERELIEKNFPRSSPGPMGIFFDSGKKLEHLVQSYWGEDFEAVTKIRAAWQELHGLETSVNYKEADLIAAMEIDRVWKIRTVESTRPMYRGINYFIDDEETLRHVEELTRVGHEFDLPISSFTHEQWVAQGFIDVLADKENTKAIWIEVQKGARAMPLQNEEPIDLDLKPPWIELISSGRFKVVKVDEQWKPTRKQLEEMAYSTIHRDSTPEELQEEIDSLLEQFEGRVSRVLLRRVGD